jgi:cytidyltransferase-like protein
MVFKKRVCVSGYFSPVHVGHLEYLQKAKDIAGPDGDLVVIVNNDNQEILKKKKVFMKGVERLKIMQALRMVDEVHLSIDQDRTVCQTIASIQPPITHFCNGGDQNNNSIPETGICKELGIELVDGLGDKIQSSSWLTGLKAVDKK